MKCTECKEDIEGSYYELDNDKEKTVCAKCYEKNHVKKCKECKEKITGTYYTVDEKFYCSTCYAKKHGDSDGKLRCEVCKDEIKGQVIRAVERAFCATCFKCSVCQKDLASADVGFTADADKKLFCQKCYSEKYAPRCSYCSLPIAPKEGETTAQRLTALDRDWHPECFKCIDCEIILDSKKGIKCYPTMEPKKEPLCGDCNQKRRDWGDFPFLLKQTSNDIRLPTALIHCICNICAKTHSSYCVITKKIAKNDKTNLLTIYAPPTELFLLVALGNCSGETFVSWWHVCIDLISSCWKIRKNKMLNPN